MKNDEVTFRPLYKQCETLFYVSAASAASKSDGMDFTVCIRTGAVALQTYATRDELRALGEMLLRHASDNEVMEVAA